MRKHNLGEGFLGTTAARQYSFFSGSCLIDFNNGESALNVDTTAQEAQNAHHILHEQTVQTAHHIQTAQEVQDIQTAQEVQDTQTAQTARDILPIPFSSFMHRNLEHATHKNSIPSSVFSTTPASNPIFYSPSPSSSSSAPLPSPSYLLTHRTQLAQEAQDALHTLPVQVAQRFLSVQEPQILQKKEELRVRLAQEALGWITQEAHDISLQQLPPTPAPLKQLPPTPAPLRQLPPTPAPLSSYRWCSTTNIAPTPSRIEVQVPSPQCKDSFPSLSSHEPIIHTSANDAISFASKAATPSPAAPSAATPSAAAPSVTDVPPSDASTLSAEPSQPKLISINIRGYLAYFKPNHNGFIQILTQHGLEWVCPIWFQEAINIVPHEIVEERDLGKSRLSKCSHLHKIRGGKLDTFCIYWLRDMMGFPSVNLKCKGGKLCVRMHLIVPELKNIAAPPPKKAKSTSGLLPPPPPPAPLTPAAAPSAAALSATPSAPPAVPSAPPAAAPQFISNGAADYVFKVKEPVVAPPPEEQEPDFMTLNQVLMQENPDKNTKENIVKSKHSILCKNVHTSSGCKYGDKCTFYHPPNTPVNTVSPLSITVRANTTSPLPVSKQAKINSPLPGSMSNDELEAWITGGALDIHAVTQQVIDMLKVKLARNDGVYQTITLINGRLLTRAEKNHFTDKTHLVTKLLNSQCENADVPDLLKLWSLLVTWTEGNNYMIQFRLSVLHDHQKALYLAQKFNWCKQGCTTEVIIEKSGIVELKKIFDSIPAGCYYPLKVPVKRCLGHPLTCRYGCHARYDFSVVYQFPSQFRAKDSLDPKCLAYERRFNIASASFPPLVKQLLVLYREHLLETWCFRHLELAHKKYNCPAPFIDRELVKMTRELRKHEETVEKAKVELFEATGYFYTGYYLPFVEPVSMYGIPSASLFGPSKTSKELAQQLPTGILFPPLVENLCKDVVQYVPPQEPEEGTISYASAVQNNQKALEYSNCTPSSSPRARSLSPRSLSPRKNIPLHRTRSLSPRTRSLSPRLDTLHPVRFMPPVRLRHKSPLKEIEEIEEEYSNCSPSSSPRTRSLSQRKDIPLPRTRSLSPRADSLSPRTRSLSPRADILRPRPVRFMPPVRLRHEAPIKEIEEIFEELNFDKPKVIVSEEPFPESPPTSAFAQETDWVETDIEAPRSIEDINKMVSTFRPISPSKGKSPSPTPPVVSHVPDAPVVSPLPQNVPSKHVNSWFWGTPDDVEAPIETDASSSTERLSPSKLKQQKRQEIKESKKNKNPLGSAEVPEIVFGESLLPPKLTVADKKAARAADEKQKALDRAILEEERERANAALEKERLAREKIAQAAIFEERFQEELARLIASKTIQPEECKTEGGKPKERKPKALTHKELETLKRAARRYAERMAIEDVEQVVRELKKIADSARTAQYLPIPEGWKAKPKSQQPKKNGKKDSLKVGKQSTDMEAL
jgi:hypothetical protein